MNPVFQSISDKIQSADHLTPEEKKSFIKAIKDSDKSQTMLQFKLERLEKDRKTLQVMLEESIEDLQKKAQAIEEQNRELEIESSLEKVRTVAMGMRKRDDMLDICRIISQQLESLGIKEIRNVQTAIFDKDKGTYVNYEYYRLHDKALVTEVDYTTDEISMEFAAEMIKGGEEIFIRGLHGQEVKDWLNFQKTTNVFIDTNLETATSLTYHWFSLGPVAIGTSTYQPLNEAEITLFKRFRNVFELAYRRYLDIEKAEAQTRESQIQLALERVRARTMAMQKSDELANVAELLFKQVNDLGIKTWTTGFNVWSDDNNFYTDYITNPQGGFMPPYTIDASKLPVSLELSNAKKRGDDFYVNYEEGETFKETYRQLSSFGEKQFKSILESGFEFPSHQYEHFVFGSKVSLMFITYESVPEAHDIFKRFGKVFEQTYTRFFDLQNAEAQARESQIQLALERVRARTMAMQEQNDLLDLLRLLVEQLIRLGVQLEIANFSNGIPAGDWNLWIQVVTDDATTYNNYVHFPRIDHPYFKHVEKNIEIFRSEGKDFFKDVFSKEEKDSWQDYINTQTIFKNLVTENHKQVIYDKSGYTWSMILLKDTWVSICRFNTIPFSDEEDALLRRFANAFGQAYTRFLDLQNAEAQARESQIQLALERVRARTMAMQKSDELRETVREIYEQLQHLGFDSNACNIIIIDKGSGSMQYWVSGFTREIFPIGYHVPYLRHAYHEELLTASRQNEVYAVMEYSGEMKKGFDEIFFTQTDFRNVPEEAKNFMMGIESVKLSTAFFTYGALQVLGPAELSGEKANILQRFAKVFDLTYTRFLDLQKAETQAREAEIELALERVRARTMAMQASEELQEVVHTVLERLKDLNVEFYTAIIILFAEDSKDIIWWLENKEKQQYSRVLVPYADIAYFRDLFLTREKGKNHFSRVYSYEEKNELFHHLFTATDFQHVPEKQKEFLLESEAATMSVAIAKNTGIHLTRYSNKTFLEEDNEILKRFAKVFEQTYTRFNDLQTAETQAREAKIEVALEKVRSRAMAMHNSEELNALIGTVFTELTKLDLQLTRCVLWIFDTQTNDAVWWMANSEDPQNPINCEVPYNAYEPFLVFVEQWKNKTIKFQYELKGQIKKDWDEYLFSKTGLSRLPDFVIAGMKAPECVLLTASFNNFGAMNVASLKPLSNEHTDILLRFAKVFDLTYTRFNDLKQAEAQAREAQIETALERVRSRTLAMQKSDELAETASVLFKQLILLGIEPNRLYINIIKDETGEAEFWITDEDGSKVSTAYTANMNDNLSFKKMYEGWKEQKKYLVIDMHGDELEEYFKHLSNLNVPFKGGLAQKRRLQYIAYFSKGFIGMASPDEQPGATVQLLERFAGVFNLTFTRFNDLKVAEAHALKAEQDLIEIKAAREKAENAFTELQATQKQLIQSEKMASLGELTAGIAHEIQNPLNFVNNFSDVSNELLEELKNELQKGNKEDIITLVDDVKQNLEKILHHGRRADAIVKGMLQHSRTSSGQKERTDINVLADEYLRLAYHGLRAKDKSFNAKFNTDFDNTIGKVNIIPQEIGRVILNLINNAFYTVSEKQRQLNGSFEPTVSVSTKKIDDKVFITITDNGNGIAQKNLDKIFQPFFTTKPTGQGTGLGLSLAYDIITKGHNGEIKIETKEGEGSKFIVIIPST